MYEAERAVAAALHNTDIGIDYGLTTTIRVQLSADADVAEHATSYAEWDGGGKGSPRGNGTTLTKGQ